MDMRTHLIPTVGDDHSTTSRRILEGAVVTITYGLATYILRKPLGKIIFVEETRTSTFVLQT